MHGHLLIGRVQIGSGTPWSRRSWRCPDYEFRYALIELEGAHVSADPVANCSPASPPRTCGNWLPARRQTDGLAAPGHADHGLAWLFPPNPRTAFRRPCAPDAARH